MTTPSLRFVLLAATLLAAPAVAQVSSVVLELQNVPGVGNVTSIANVVINDDGEWIVEVDTDNPDTTADGALLSNGVLLLREGQLLPAPIGASIGSFDRMATPLKPFWP